MFFSEEEFPKTRLEFQIVLETLLNMFRDTWFDKFTIITFNSEKMLLIHKNRYIKPDKRWFYHDFVQINIYIYFNQTLEILAIWTVPQIWADLLPKFVH